MKYLYLDRTATITYEIVIYQTIFITDELLAQ